MSLDQQLATLQRRGLIQRQSIGANDTSTFKHLLVQDSAYRSLLREERRLLHGLTGEVIERLSAGDEPSHAPQLAHHFEQAGDHVRAHEYSLLAGGEAARVHAYAEAVAHFERSLRSAQSLQDGRAAALALSFDRLGRALELAGDHGRAFDTYVEAQQTGAELDSPELELLGMIRQGTLLATPSPLMDRPRGIELSQQTLALARQHGALEAEIRSLWNLTLAKTLTAGLEAEAVQHGERALELAEQFGDPELTAFLHNDVGRSHLFAGDVERAERLLKTAERRWRENNNLPMLVDSLVTQVGVAVSSGDLKSVPAAWQEANEIAQQTGNTWARTYSRMFLEAYYLAGGEYGRGIEVAEKTLAMAESSGMTPIVIMVKLNLAELHLELNSTDAALGIAESSLQLAGRMRHNWLSAMAGLVARIHLKRGELEAAVSVLDGVEPVYESGGEGFFSLASIPSTLALSELALAQRQWDRAHEIARRMADLLGGMQLELYLPLALLLKGRASLMAGDAAAAEAAFAQGEATARGHGMATILWKLLAARAEAAASQGKPDLRARLRQEAAQIVNDIAASLEGSQYHESFVSQPEIRALRESAS